MKLAIYRGSGTYGGAPSFGMMEAMAYESLQQATRLRRPDYVPVPPAIVEVESVRSWKEACAWYRERTQEELEALFTGAGTP